MGLILTWCGAIAACWQLQKPPLESPPEGGASIRPHDRKHPLSWVPKQQVVSWNFRPSEFEHSRAHYAPGGTFNCNFSPFYYKLIGPVPPAACDNVTTTLHGWSHIVETSLDSASDVLKFTNFRHRSRTRGRGPFCQYPATGPEPVHSLVHSSLRPESPWKGGSPPTPLANA